MRVGAVAATENRKKGGRERGSSMEQSADEGKSAVADSRHMPARRYSRALPSRSAALRQSASPFGAIILRERTPGRGLLLAAAGLPSVSRETGCGVHHREARMTSTTAPPPRHRGRGLPPKRAAQAAQLLQENQRLPARSIALIKKLLPVSAQRPGQLCFRPQPVHNAARLARRAPVIPHKLPPSPQGLRRACEGLPSREQ